MVKWFLCFLKDNILQDFLAVFKLHFTLFLTACFIQSLCNYNSLIEIKQVVRYEELIGSVHAWSMKRSLCCHSKTILVGVILCEQKAKAQSYLTNALILLHSARQTFLISPLSSCAA